MISRPTVEVTGSWRLPDGKYLLRGCERPWPMSGIGSIRQPDGSELAGWRRYWISAPDGTSLTTYPDPKVYSLEDFLYLYDLVAVADRQLCQFLWEQQAFVGDRLKLSAVLLDGLVECDLASIPPQMID